MSDASTPSKDGTLLSRSVSIPATVPALVDLTGCSELSTTVEKTADTCRYSLEEIGAKAVEWVTLEARYRSQCYATPLNQDRRQQMLELADVWKQSCVARKELEQMAFCLPPIAPIGYTSEGQG